MFVSILCLLNLGFLSCHFLNMADSWPQLDFFFVCVLFNFQKKHFGFGRNKFRLIKPWQTLGRFGSEVENLF